MRAADRIFWVALRHLRPRWKEALIVIQPSTIVRWHREGFRGYWTWKSRRRFIGRPSTKAEIRAFTANFSCSASTFPSARSPD